MLPKRSVWHGGQASDVLDRETHETRESLNLLREIIPVDRGFYDRSGGFGSRV